MSEDNLNDARAKVAFTAYKNSLIEWTLTDEWTNPPNIHLDKKARGNQVCRGLMIYKGHQYHDNIASGEIDAKH